jgi:chromosome segregation ATPase
MTPRAKLAALQKVLETTKEHNQKLREENEKIRAELRTTVVDRDMFYRRMMELREETEKLLDRLHRANLNSARAKHEAVLVRKDGWSKVVDCQNNADTNPFCPRPARFLGGPLNSVTIFHMTSETDPFGRPIYRQQ